MPTRKKARSSELVPVIEGVCTECGSELVHDICPTPGCFGLPPSVLDSDDRVVLTQNISLEAARSLIPYLLGSRSKFNYISMRYAGYTMDEVLKLGKVSKHTLDMWRASDPRFRQLEGSLAGQHRREIRRELQTLVFTRNMHLAMLKDSQVLERAVVEEYDTDGQPIPISDADMNYLKEIRKYYTPQQLDVLDRVTGKGDGEGGMVEEIVLKARRWISNARQETEED